MCYFIQIILTELCTTQMKETKQTKWFTKNLLRIKSNCPVCILYHEVKWVLSSSLSLMKIDTYLGHLDVQENSNTLWFLYILSMIGCENVAQTNSI